MESARNAERVQYLVTYDDDKVPFSFCYNLLLVQGLTSNLTALYHPILLSKSFLVLLQSHRKFFITRQAKFNPEHNLIKCVGN